MAKAVKKTNSKTTKRTTTAKAKTATTSVPKTMPAQRVTKSRSRAIPTEEQIRQRAFEIYVARNGAPGNAHEDWVQAERELRG